VLVENVGQVFAEHLHILFVFEPHIQISQRFDGRVVPLVMNGEREHTRLVGEDRCRTVAVMDI